MVISTFHFLLKKRGSLDTSFVFGFASAQDTRPPISNNYTLTFHIVNGSSNPFNSLAKHSSAFVLTFSARNF